MTKVIALAANTSWYLFNFRRSTILAFLNSGYHVVCICPYDQWSKELEKLGARFVPLQIDASGVNPISEMLVFVRILALLVKEKPAYLFNFTIKINLYFGLAALILRIPYANNISGLGTAFIHDSLLFRFVRRIYKLANHGARQVFFQNPDDLELFVLKGLVDSKIAVLLPGSGVDISRFSFTTMNTTLPITFLMIARLITDKGVREYVAAARIVRLEKPYTRFILVGSNKVLNRTAISDEEIQEWIDEDLIEFPGEQIDVRPWLETCHIFVLPSYREGMPRTVLEAAAVGRPSIVTNVTGCKHAVMPGETGWLCEARDSQDLALTMIAALEEKDLPIWGRRARERVVAHFAEDIVVNNYLRALNCLTDPSMDSQ